MTDCVNGLQRKILKMEEQASLKDLHLLFPLVSLLSFRRVNQVGDYVSYCSLPCTLYESINK